MKKYRTLKLQLNNGELISELSSTQNQILEKNPITYVYYNLEKKLVYVGETNCFNSRHLQHLGENNPKVDYRNFNQCLVIYSRLFNKSSTLDLEFLILNYMVAESDVTKFIFANRNSGQTELVYENKEKILSEVFYPLWKNELSLTGLVDNPNIAELRNKLLFKYSPFKKLSVKQKRISTIIASNYKQKYLVEAPAGSGKSVLFTNMAFSLAENNPNLRIGLITTGNLTKQFNLIFKSVGLNESLVVKTASQLIMNAKKNEKKYDIIIVDEAHKLKKHYRKGHPNARKHLSEGDEEITLLEELTEGLVLLYDPYQGIKPQNISISGIKNLTKDYEQLMLMQQFRIGGNSGFSGEDFLKGVLYGLQLSKNNNFNQKVFKDDYFRIVDTFSEVFEYVDERSHVFLESTNRVIAGYCREWASNSSKISNKGKKNDELPFDWNVDSIEKRWNSTYEDWIEKTNSENEIGSIHAIQGYDLNYAGVIVGNDLTVNDGQIVALPDNYKDIGGMPLKEGFSLIELTEYLLNIYYVLLSRGIDGCAVYFEDKNVEKLFKERVGL